MEMQHKLPEVLLEFKKGNLPEDGLKSMVALAQDLMKQYK
jgi:F-type H+-transporting ATPase subunit alpha